MKPNNFWGLGLSFWLTIIFTTACNSSRVALQSDQQIIANFQRHKPESIALMKQCESESVTDRSSVNFTVELFFHCNSKIEGKDSHELANYLDSLNLEYIAQKFTSPEYPSKQFKGTPYLFVVDQVIYDDYDTIVEEKGYIFSDASLHGGLEPNEIVTGSLSQFEQGLDTRGRKDRSEIWKFKQIEPNWYLYYRHFFRAR